MGAIREYNEKMFTPCKLPKASSNSLVTHHGSEGSQYIDNKNKLKFTFDHIRREPINEEHCELPSGLQGYFEAVDKGINAYVNEHYKNGNYAIYIKKTDDIFVTVCIESHAYNPDNFWNGVLTCDYTANASTLKVKGKITSTIHYFEDGNVQMSSNKVIEGDMKPCKDEKEFGAHFTDFIRITESKYQEAVVDDINNMMDTTFKALRRVLPITRSKIQWEKINAYVLGHELSK
ncbi:F-actin-capping protein subunit alpha-1 [Thelohanellus kitauei]|uniref:F-actin-capping protein subunit alpha n=1 Tax=Thelohanellus kitauei TaxID=669202 RepID=A0A0C2MND4_THEKT|nr:F-actin-capping protein subunit alpha-1 [Thelohanellus kitauei]